MTIDTARELYPLYRKHLPELREWHRLDILDPGMYPTYRNQLLADLMECRAVMRKGQ